MPIGITECLTISILLLVKQNANYLLQDAQINKCQDSRPLDGS